MRLASKITILALIPAICGCVTTKPNPLNQQGITSKPYDGLNKASYGGLTRTPTKYCDSKSNDPIASGVNDLTVSLLSPLYKPVGGLTVYDDTLVKEDLQDQFRVIGDFAYANVVVLHRDENEITFWYGADVVAGYEIENAAKKYCGYRKKVAAFEGNAQRCGPVEGTVKSIVTVNGQGSTTQIIPTFVIASFACQ